MSPEQRFLVRLASSSASAPAGAAVLVTVVRTEGSVPRESGTWMAVFADTVQGTIGGGRLEFDAITEARAQLAARLGHTPPPPRSGATAVWASGPAAGSTVAPASTTVEPSSPVRRYPLGPSLGQCCGGVVYLRYERVGAADVAALRTRLRPRRWPVALFGGGHVGAALARVLEPLPFALTWIDSRDEIFPDDVPGDAVCEHSDPVRAAVPTLAPGSRVLIMSFSHAEDLDVVAACLMRRRIQADLPFVGLIGSHTKWATFRHRLEARGFTEDELAGITCPIGVPGIHGKQPEVIAVAVAAQLLQTVADDEAH